MNFWNDMKRRQLQSIYKEIGDIDGILSREAIKLVTRSNPHDWSPIDTMLQSESQSLESFEEQKDAMNLLQYTIYKYCSGVTMTHTKAAVILGAPGTGKTYIEKWLYYLLILMV